MEPKAMENWFRWFCFPFKEVIFWVNHVNFPGCKVKVLYFYKIFEDCKCRAQNAHQYIAEVICLHTGIEGDFDSHMNDNILHKV